MGEVAETYIVDDALISLGFGKYQALILVYSGVAYAAEAMEVMILSFIGSAVQSKWNLSPHEKSLIASVVFAGMLVGAYSWGVVSDYFGRRQGFLFTALVTSVVGFVSSFSPNYISLVILRFFVGIGLGGGPVLFSWFLEFVPAPNRGAWMVVFSFFWSIGTILEASLAWAVMPTLGWRWLLALSSLPSFLLLVFYTITPESPRYLCSKGRKSDALLVLQRMARMNRKPLPSGELVSDRNWGSDELDENANGSAVTHAAHASRAETSFTKDVSSKVKCVGSLYKLLSRKLLRTTLLLWIGFFGNAFTYYGVILLTSGLSDGGCGVTKKDKVGTRLYKDVFITSLAEFPGLLLSAVIVDRIGRKFTVALMLFGTFAFLIPLVSHYRELTTTVLLFCARICITGSITTLSIYAPEVYPTSVRSTGYGTANSVGKIGGIVSPIVAVGLIDGCHQTAAVLLFAGIIIATAVGVLFFPIETKGSSLKDSVDSLVTSVPESKPAALN
ncbi:Organic cation/carnitine transporter 7 [Platanthera guangdongensis]|uniref:Organic cation/carnitine transporter 7 n=1 Tax=Platanthera guangdongensis TaxID=2320717 RepID=A0ABR2MYH5_9ASPA